MMAKAIRAADSARILLDSGDPDGACNRAYYAMYAAARSALLASEQLPELESAKTHAGLISAFSLRLVKTGRVSVELGRSLNRAEELRLLADYKRESIEIEDAAWVVSEAQTFVHEMQTRFIPTASKDIENG